MNKPDMSEIRPVPLVFERIPPTSIPDLHFGRLDIGPTDYFVFTYRQKTDALDRQWSLVELYHHLEYQGTVLVTNCTHMLGAVMNSGIMYGLRVNLEHVVDTAHKKRMQEKDHKPLDWNDE